MNMKKPKIMWFETSESIKAVDSNYSISIDGVLLSTVHNYPYSVVEPDEVLSYDEHLDNVVTKTTQKLYTFRKIRRFIYQLQ